MSTEKDVVNTEWFGAVRRWNEERGLDQLPYNHRKEVSFILEELHECNGDASSEELRKTAELDAEIIAVEEPSDEELVVDAFADIIVYATGAILKLGYDPELVMQEVFKAINSRTGELIDGKFVKDPEAVRYEPDYSTCRRNQD